jgi:hypothetical protein
MHSKRGIPDLAVCLLLRNHSTSQAVLLLFAVVTADPAAEAVSVANVKVTALFSAITEGFAVLLPLL